MSKTKGSGKGTWDTVDKRVRDRREAWNAGELDELEQQLGKLPDVAEQAERIDIDQPAVGPRNAQAGDGEEADEDAAAAVGSVDAATSDGTN